MQERRQNRLQRLERLAYYLDEAFRVPGTNYRIGYDALVGLVPGVGDVAGLGVSSYFVWQASRFGLSRWTLLRMVFNVAVETILGAVPLLGDVFDATWKANARNLQLLRDHLDERRDARSDRRYLAGILILLAGLVVLLLVLLVYGLVALVRAIGG